MQASALLLCWGSYHWTHNLWVLTICLFFLPIMLPSVVPRLATDSAVRVFPGVWKLLSFLRLPFLDGAPSLPLCLSFCLLYFFLPSSEDNGLLFWVPDVQIGKGVCQGCILLPCLSGTQKSNPSLQKEVEKNIKVKKRDKRGRDGVLSREGSLKKREVSKHQETHSLPNLCRALEAQRAT